MNNMKQTKTGMFWVWLYAGLIILFFTAFQGYWLFDVYNSRHDVTVQETENIMKEYVLGRDALILTNSISKDVMVTPQNLGEMMALKPKSAVHVEVVSGGDLDEKKLAHALDSLMKKDKLLNLVNEMLEPVMKAEINKKFPGLEFSLEKNAPATNNIDDIKVGSKTNPKDNYTLSFTNLRNFLIWNMRGIILLSLLCLAVCVTSVLLLVKNISKSRRLMEMKDNFTHNITHEIKTPIATLFAATEALDKYNMIQDENMSREYIGIIQSGLKRLQFMTETMLNSASLAEGKLQLQKEEVSVNSLLQEAEKTVTPLADKKEATITFTGLHEDISILADKEHLTNVLCNLIDNAFKYSKKDIRIAISATDNDNSVSIKVADNGIGIPQEYQKEIFKPYFRVPEGDRHTVKGYGLGLSYVKDIMELHGGGIKLTESKLGEGSVFEITIPKTNG